MVFPQLTYMDLRKYLGISAKKRLGQHFLLDEGATDRIAEIAKVKDCHVIEVGPGPGPITRSILLRYPQRLDVVEMDKRFIPILKRLKSSTDVDMCVHNFDIMRFNMSALLRDIQKIPWDDDRALPMARLVGNLPFNISIGLLLQWLRGISLRQGPFQFGRIPMYLTFQKEVAENLVASNHFDKSRLTIMTQAFCKVKPVMMLHRTLFVPQPKVDSILVELVPLVTPQVNAGFDILEQVVKCAFQHRDKHIGNSLKNAFTQNKCEYLVPRILKGANIDSSLATSLLTISAWSDLCDSFMEVMQEEELPLIIQPVKSPPVICHYDHTDGDDQK